VGLSARHLQVISAEGAVATLAWGSAPGLDVMGTTKALKARIYFPSSLQD